MAMEIDHFDPANRDSREGNRYENLFQAVACCNRRKSDNWPTAEEQAKGIRFLNPCKEMDYSLQESDVPGKIYEDPKTHRVFGTDPASKYHVHVLGLNDNYFVEQRRERAKIKNALETKLFELDEFAPWGNKCDHLVELEGILKGQLEKFPASIKFLDTSYT